MALLYSEVVQSISMTNLNDFKVCYSRRDRAGKMEDRRDRRGIKGRSSPIPLYPKSFILLFVSWFPDVTSFVFFESVNANNTKITITKIMISI